MSTLIDGARQLPTSHLSIRVPWTDTGWDGRVCQSPLANNSCLILKNVAGKRNDAQETGCAGRFWNELKPSELPACKAERGAFMAPFEYVRYTNHPYKESTDLYEHFAETPFSHPAYSAACVPFLWMRKEQAEGTEDEVSICERFQLGYDAAREPELPFETGWVQERRNQRVMLDTFFSAVRPSESLCFFYAKRTPLSDDPRRVIVGVGRVTQVGPPVDYRYDKALKKRGSIECCLWERNVHHSIRPDFKEGFVLPYQALLQAAADDPTLDPSQFVAFAPRDYHLSFSFGSEHVSHDAAIASLLACADVIARVGAHVPGDWGAVLAWIDAELNRLWRMRGPFPGIGSALCAFGLEHGTLIGHELARMVTDGTSEWREDPWLAFERVLESPKSLGNLSQYLGPTWLTKWRGLSDDRRRLLKLLSRFDISADQARRMFLPEEREDAGITATDEQLLANPYAIFELDRASSDPIELGKVDRGIFPESIVRERFPLEAPTALAENIDPRRVRAHVVEALEMAAATGHTLQPRSWISRAVREKQIRPSCPADTDLLGSIEKSFPPVVQLVALEAGNEPGYQLDRLASTKDLISSSIEKRKVGLRHKGSYDWRKLVDQELSSKSSKGSTLDDRERLARDEKSAALEQLFASRICVLVGPAGTGKTTLLSALCKLPDVKDGGILLLAPTGKARVRLESQTKLSGAKTIAQFLLPLERYDTSTGNYLVTRAAPYHKAEKTVVIDEASMLTEEQLAAVLDALQGVARLILVGDPRQLPPIGSGRPFLDIVEHLSPSEEVLARTFPRVGPCYAELTIRRRQEGVDRPDMLLARWFSGQAPDAGGDEIWSQLKEGLESEYLALVQWDRPDELQEKLLDRLVSELGLAGRDDEDGFEVALGGWRPESGNGVWFKSKYKDRPGAAEKAEAWQILSPVRANTYGVEALNRTIQETFRQRAFEWATPVRVTTKSGEEFVVHRVPKPMGRHRIVYGDKVINTRNHQRHSIWPKDGLRYVANGEVGIVVGKYKKQGQGGGNPKNLAVEFSSQLGYEYSFWPGDFGEDRDDALELAYALTVHRCQGSEFGVTFVVIPYPCSILSRELLYTALTRQQRKVIVFHQGSFAQLRNWCDDYHSDMARRLTNLFKKPKPVIWRERYFEERLIHRTARGEPVRSKSEVIIANQLSASGVSYVYEQEREGKLPDFTLENAETGLTVYWEHLGLLHEPSYRERWRRKLEWYRKSGVFPLGEWTPEDAGLLVVSRDDANGGLDSSWLQLLIDRVIKGSGPQSAVDLVSQRCPACGSPNTASEVMVVGGRRQFRCSECAPN